MMCDDQIMFLDLISEYLNNYADFNIVKSASSGEDCLDLIKNGIVPDILILDISMPPGMPGYLVAKHLQKNYPSIKIIALSMLTDSNAVKAMIRYGAKGFLFKESKPCEIVRVIKLVNQGAEYYPKCLNLSPNEILVLKNTTIDWLENITRTESVAARLIAKDLSINQVADEMNMSVSVVNKKIKRLFLRTNTNTRTGLLYFLRKVGILE